MGDYISREAAKQVLDWHLVGDVADTACKLIDTVPAADVGPVRHGRWMDNGIPDSMLTGCSACGFPCGAYSFRYCPNCGAKMDGGAEHEAD